MTRDRTIGLIGGILCFLAVVTYATWEFAHRGVYLYNTQIYPLDDADEWRYTACSRLVNHGYALFSEVYSAQPPLLFASLAAGMRLLGDSIDGARWVEISCGLVGLLSAIWIAWMLTGPVAGAATGLFLSISPAFLVYSHTVEAEGPMMALVTLGVALALFYVKTGNWVVLVAAGLAIAAAILTKLFAAEAVIPVLWLISAGRPADPWSILRRISIFLAAVILPVTLDFVLLSPSQQWDQVIRLHEKAASLDLPGVIPPSQLFRDFASLDPGLVILAAAALALLAIERRWFEVILFALWVGGTVAMLLSFRPLFPHHLAILSTGLGVVAGVGAGIAFEEILKRRWIRCLPVAAALVVYALFLPHTAHADRHVLVAGEKTGISRLVSYVDRATSPDQFVAVDDLQVAERARRLVPPQLCDPSNVRLRAGFLTAQTLIGSTEHYRAALVLSSGIYEQVPEYVRWLETHYRRIKLPPLKTAYVRP